jgi:hypothetical protein
MRYHLSMKFHLAVLSLVLLVSCSGKNASTSEGKKHDEKPVAPPAASNGQTPSTDASQCDKALWDHVYDPTRLEVVEDCKTATGVIDELDENTDGDTHMLLKLDEGQEQLLNKRNKKKKDNELVVEVVCSAPVKEKKAKDACAGYTNAVTLPKVGDRVRVTGTLVIDSHNGWSEIHPASRIEVQ